MSSLPFYQVIHGLIPIFLYAEVHYVWKWLPSRIFISQPEIIADAPHRVTAGSPIPILLIIKDSDSFPVELKTVDVEVNTGKSRSPIYHFDFNAPVRNKLWSDIIEIDPPAGFAGDVAISVTFNLNDVHDEPFVVVNDNYKGLSSENLKVQISQDPLPSLQGWRFGEFHSHSEYTSDKVEFGSPLKASARLCRALGIDFFIVSDHSYNLDNSIDTPFYNDPTLPRWLPSRKTMDEMNIVGEVIPVPAEEVSCGNTKNQNVHCLILNSSKFIPGSGDSEDNFPNRTPDHSIPEILDIMDTDAIAVAAHPCEKPPLAQRLIFNRGIWNERDCEDERIIGLQILNGLPDSGFWNGMKIWKNLLLKGHKKIILAGNDAHGNFNRFRQVKIPFLSMHEHTEQIFGQARTALFINDEISLDTILMAIKKRHAMITTGPLAEINYQNNESNFMTGDIAPLGQGIMRFNAVTSREFGALDRILIRRGVLHSNKEFMVAEYNDLVDLYEYQHEVEISADQPGYIRLEVYSRSEHGEHICFTNPIWFDSTG